VLAENKANKYLTYNVKRNQKLGLNPRGMSVRFPADLDLEHQTQKIYRRFSEKQVSLYNWLV